MFTANRNGMYTTFELHFMLVSFSFEVYNTMLGRDLTELNTQQLRK